MTVFMVERNLNGFAMSALAAAQQLAIKTADDYATKGTPMRYFRSTFAPGDGRCMCLFEAGSADDVKRLNDEAGDDRQKRLLRAKAASSVTELEKHRHFGYGDNHSGGSNVSVAHDGFVRPGTHGGVSRNGTRPGAG